MLHGQIQYFLEIIIDEQVFPFAAISPIHWNNKSTPQINLSLGKVITNLKPNNILYIIPATYLNGIISLFPLKQLIFGEEVYVVSSYKFQLM